MKSRRTINVDKKCFDVLKSYCDDHGLKSSHFLTMAVTNEISRRRSHLDPLFVKSDNSEINIKLVELFYRTLDIGNNLKVWVQNIVKTGNSYVKLNTEMEGIVSYENCENMKRVEAGKRITFQCGDKVLENYEVLHFRHLGNSDYLPYGVAVEFKKDIFSTSTSTSNNRTVSRLVRIVEGELSRAAIVHLYAMGYRDNDLVDFTLKIDDDFIKAIIYDYCSDIKNECGK
jgi:hypothetical protein